MMQHGSQTITFTSLRKPFLAFGGCWRHLVGQSLPMENPPFLPPQGSILQDTSLKTGEIRLSSMKTYSLRYFLHSVCTSEISLDYYIGSIPFLIGIETELDWKSRILTTHKGHNVYRSRNFFCMMVPLPFVGNTLLCLGEEHQKHPKLHCKSRAHGGENQSRDQC